MEQQLVEQASNGALISLHNTDQVIIMAKELAAYIKRQGLSVRIGSRDYVMVEGWEFAGARLGIIPYVESEENLSTDKEIKYKVTVLLKDMNRGMATIGRGIAICSDKDAKKKSFDEYAVLSMAQTRAIGKAYRNLIGWIIKAAGYETTPAEEIPAGGISSKQGRGIPKEDLELIKEEIALMNTADELIDYCEKWKQYHKDKQFRQLIVKRKNQILKLQK
jgi:hypothetical protein